MFGDYPAALNMHDLDKSAIYGKIFYVIIEFPPAFQFFSFTL